MSQTEPKQKFNTNKTYTFINDLVINFWIDSKTK